MLKHNVVICIAFLAPEFEGCLFCFLFFSFLRCTSCSLRLRCVYLQVVFWGTLALMMVCYTLISKKVYESYKASKSSCQAASRSTKAKVFIVVAVFFVCFAPFHFTRVPYTQLQTGSMVTSCRGQNALSVAKQSTLWLSATNVCLDPLIYVFLCGVFRKRLWAALGRGSVQRTVTESRMETCSQLEMLQVVQSNGRALQGTHSCQPANQSDSWKNS